MKIKPIPAVCALALVACLATPAYSADADNPETFNLRIGALAERADLPPQRQIWCEAALPWTADLLGLPGKPKQ